MADWDVQSEEPAVLPTGPKPEPTSEWDVAHEVPAPQQPSGGSQFRHGWGLATGALGDVLKAPGAAVQSMVNSFDTIGSALNPEERAKKSVLQNTLDTGKAILSGITALPAAAGAAAEQVLGPTYGEAVHGVGRLIAPQTAATDNPEQLHQMGQEAIGKSLQGIRAAGDVVPMPARAPGMAAGPYEIPEPVTTAAPAPGGGQTQITTGPQPVQTFVPKPAPPQPPKVPTWQEAETAAKQNFQNAEGYGIELHERATNRLADDVKTRLEQGNKRDFKEPSVFKIVDELRKPPGEYSTIGDIWSVRQALNDVPIADRPAARIAQKEIDDYLRNRMSPNDAAINGHFVTRAGPELKEGIDNYAIAKHGERLDLMNQSAERTQARKGTPAEQTLRTKLQAIVDNPRRQRGWSKEDLAAADAVVNGSPIAEAPRRILQKVGWTSHYVPGLKAAADITSNISTARRAEALRRQIMMRAPLYQKALAQHKAGLTPPAPGTPSPGGVIVTGRQYRKPPIGQPQQLTSSGEEPPEAHAAGGTVKLSHQAVSYSKGHGVQFCRTCKFSDHKPSPACDWVVDIKLDGWCTLWKR